MAQKIIIYTSITGSYDTLLQPSVKPDDFDFVCFVAKGGKTADYQGVWRIEEIPYPWDDMVLLSRSQKMNPHSVLPPEYEYSLWIDGNIGITGPQIYDVCRELRDRDVHYAGVCHPFRDCVYEEMSNVLRDRRESLWQLLRVVNFLRRNHLPRHAGLMENNVIFRRHNAPEVVEFDRWWWECFLKFPRRDQLTHTFAMVDTPSLKAEYIFPKGTTARNFEGLEYHKHPSKPLNWLQRKRRYGLNGPKDLILKSYIWLRFLFEK